MPCYETSQGNFPALAGCSAFCGNFLMVSMPLTTQMLGEFGRVVVKAYNLIDKVAPFPVKAHSTRSVSASWGIRYLYLRFASLPTGSLFTHLSCIMWILSPL